MDKKYEWTKKDVVIVVAFCILAIANIVFRVLADGFKDVDTIILQTLLLLLGFVGFVDMCSYLNWNVFVPDFKEHKRKEKAKEDAKRYASAYLTEDAQFIQNYNQERMSYFLSRIGISLEQFDKMRIELIRIRCMPLKSLSDAAEKIKNFVTLDYPIIVNQDVIDSSKLSYSKVRYFINFSDTMFIHDYALEFSSILAFLIAEKIDIRRINKIIIPHDSNFLLGIEVSKILGKTAVKMRSGRGMIISEQYWEGSLDVTDTVVIVHDVLVTAKQIGDALDKIPKTCNVLGLFCLVARTEWNGVETLSKRGVKVERIIDLCDEDIRKLRGD
jgi:adenine/guanine phosphoribosyltransferase-like PRPP-binding protein/flagellar basal body-associated protein FliL